MRILTLGLGVPFPPIGGGLTRTYHLLRSLASHHEVVLAAFTYGEPHDRPPYPLQLETAPWQWSEAYRDMTGADAEAARRAFHRLAYEDDDPWFASVMEPTAMHEVLARVLRSRIDLVLVEGTPLARFLPSIPRELPRVLDLFDVHSVMARSHERSAGGGPEARAREAARTLTFERRAAQACDVCLTVSTEEAVAARTLLGAAHVRVIPNGVDTSYFTPSPAARPEAGALLFTGRMSYEPNADAACYFAQAVLPLVQRDVAHARFHVVGAGPPPRVLALASEAVVIHGRVDDVRDHQWSSEVVVVPVREGGGTRLKVLEAAACGQAIVSTTLGIEGLPFRAGRDLLVADSAADFATAVVALLRDPVRRAELGARARAVAVTCDWSPIGETFRRILEETVVRT